jgi:hypothetical protein
MSGGRVSRRGVLYPEGAGLPRCVRKPSRDKDLQRCSNEGPGLIKHGCSNVELRLSSVCATYKPSLVSSTSEALPLQGTSPLALPLPGWRCAEPGLPDQTPSGYRALQRQALGWPSLPSGNPHPDCGTNAGLPSRGVPAKLVTMENAPTPEQLAEEAWAAFRKTPLTAQERFEFLVGRGIIDRQGRVLVAKLFGEAGEEAVPPTNATNGPPQTRGREPRKHIKIPDIPPDTPRPQTPRDRFSVRQPVHFAPEGRGGRTGTGAPCRFAGVGPDGRIPSTPGP